jgi:hypothetical protein
MLLITNNIQIRLPEYLQLCNQQRNLDWNSYFFSQLK